MGRRTAPPTAGGTARPPMARPTAPRTWRLMREEVTAAESRPRVLLGSPGSTRGDPAAAPARRHAVALPLWRGAAARPGEVAGAKAPAAVAWLLLQMGPWMLCCAGGRGGSRSA